MVTHIHQNSTKETLQTLQEFSQGVESGEIIGLSVVALYRDSSEHYYMANQGNGVERLIGAIGVYKNRMGA